MGFVLQRVRRIWVEYQVNMSKAKSMTKSQAQAYSANRTSREEFESVMNGARNVLSKPALAVLESFSDPKHSKPARIPTGIPGLAGRTGTTKTKLEGVVTIGTNGLGFLLIENPNLIGPYSDIAVVAASDSAFTGTTLTATTATVGVNAGYWSNGIVAASAMTDTTDAQRKLGYRCSGLIVETKPISSLAGTTPQNGREAALQEPNGATLHGLTYDGLASYTEAVSGSGVSANSNGAGGKSLKLRFRPKCSTQTSSVGAYEADPWEFRSHYAASTSLVEATLAVAFSGTAGTQYAYEINANWELRGTLVTSKRSVPPDSRGLDLALWAMNEHLSSAFFGNPRDVFHQSLAHIYRAVHKHGSHAMRKILVEDASPKSNLWWNIAKKLVSPQTLHTIISSIGL